MIRALLAAFWPEPEAPRDHVITVAVPFGTARVNQSLVARKRESLGIASWEGSHPLHEHLRRVDAAKAKARLTLHRRAS